MAGEFGWSGFRGKPSCPETSSAKEYLRTRLPSPAETARVLQVLQSKVTGQLWICYVIVSTVSFPADY